MNGRAFHMIFDLLVACGLAAAVFSAWFWPFETGLFPLVIGIPVLVLALAQILRDALEKGKEPSPERAASQEIIHDVPVDHTVPAQLVFRRAGGFYGSAVGLFLLILLVGFHIAVPLFLIALLRFNGKASWPLVIALTSVILLLIFGVFDQLLYVPWPEPLIKSLLYL